MTANINGVLLLDKAKNISSNKALQQVKRLLEATKAGHTGTLDPLATGLLPVCLGEATKYAGYLLAGDKSYTAVIKFGAATTTGDAEGAVNATADRKFTAAELETVLPEFTGTVMQTPPLFSALKVAGRPLYAYARAGQDIARTARKVLIKELSLLDFSYPLATVAVVCGGGTYIRVLAEDIARRLGSYAHLFDLRRTATQNFTLAAAYTAERLKRLDLKERRKVLLPVTSLLGDMPHLYLTQKQTQEIKQGKSVHFHLSYAIITVLSLYSPAQNFLGLGQYNPEKNELRALRLMNTGQEGSI